jgi:CheY-like chemotaxis protein
MNTEAPSLPMGSGEIVLLVEDDASLRRMAGIQLRSLGHKVLEAEDGQAALRVLQSEGPIDLLLTDVMLGGLSGAELGREARKVRPGLKLMYMSGYPRVGPDDRHPLERDVTLLRKPFLRKEIAVNVRKALEAS